MSIKYTDAGRSEAGYKGKKDCGIRAVVIATGMAYKDAQKLLRKHAKNGRKGKGSISNGIFKEDFNSALEELGFKWFSAPKFDGRKARYSDIDGVAILRMSKHYVTVVDGVLHDSFDSRHKMVYGYWKKVA